jgi:hypothetical protein
MSDREAQVVAQVDKRIFLGGKWRNASSGATFEVEDPSTRKVLCEVADAGKEDALAALAAAPPGPPRGGDGAPPPPHTPNKTPQTKKKTPRHPTRWGGSRIGWTPCREAPARR